MTQFVNCDYYAENQYWYYYFHLDYDYTNIVSTLRNGNDQFLKKAVEYGEGIRVLRQEPFEMLISYIISQRKNISAIKTCIEKMCKKYGARRTVRQGDKEKRYYTFPTAETLSRLTEEELDELGLGYRSAYVLQAARQVAYGKLVLDNLFKEDYTKVIATLKGLYGVGDKVANCVALFGLEHIEAFPIDVWIQRIIDNVYKGHFDVSKYTGYAGIVQQYMFYYYRNK